MRWGYCNGCITSMQLSTRGRLSVFLPFCHRRSFKPPAIFALLSVYINVGIVLRKWTSTFAIQESIPLLGAGGIGFSNRLRLAFFVLFVVRVIWPPSISRLLHVAHIFFTACLYPLDLAFVL